MIRILLCLALAAGSFFAWPTATRAAESYDNCTGFIDSLPATISTQGTWCLDKNLSTSMTSGNAIEIATNNVTIDCNNFKIGGLTAGTGTGTTGIHALSRLNATVRHCNIRGFYYGIYIFGSGGHLVEDNSLDGNTHHGVLVAGNGSTIRNNLVIDTGGSTKTTGSAYGIYARHGVDIINNTVNGVAPEGENANASGIFTNANGEGSVSGNRVRGLAAIGAGDPTGIYILGSGRGVTRDNDVQGPGPGVAGGVGILCDGNAATARNNMVGGFATGVMGCLSSSNIVNPN